MSHSKSNGQADDELDVSYIQNPDVKHEHSDVRIKPILMFGVYLLIAAVVIYFLMYWMYQYFEKREERTDSSRSPFAAERQVLPPQPRLQLAPSQQGQPAPNILSEHPIEEMKAMREEEQYNLDHYGWVDENSGVVRLPIREAKRLVLEKGGFASRQAGSEQEQMPSDPSSGHKMEKRQP